MMNLTPYLLFDGDCAEAMTFYKSCLGGELDLTEVGDSFMKDQAPLEDQHKILHAHLKSGLMEFSATDWLHPTRRPKQGNTVCLHLEASTYAELKTVFDKLSEGADPQLLDELRDLPFGTYGHLADKYGVHWFFKGDHKPGA